MPTFGELLCQLSGLSSGTVGEHLCAAVDNIGTGPGGTVYVPVVVEGLIGYLVEEEAGLVAPLVEEEQVTALVMDEESPLATIADEEEAMTGVMVVEEELLGVLDDGSS